MKLLFMKQQALEILKSNLESVYNKYFTETDNKWLWQVCGGDPFVEYKEIKDFQLTNLESDYTIGEIELNNCKLVYENMMFLNESQASDERLWAGLCHSVFYGYLRKRWHYDTKTPKTVKEAVSNIKSRFFFSGGTRAGLYRNSISKCWWVGRNTFDETNANPFEKLDIIGSNDISSKISDIFYSNSFSSNPMILDGIVKGLEYFKEENITLTNKEHIRPSLQLLNAIGGGIVLDCLNSDEISEIFIDNIYTILQGDDQGVDSIVETYEDNCETESIEDETEIPDLTISLGQKVTIKNQKTGKSKLIAVDYLSDTHKMHDVAKVLLGKKIGNTVEVLNEIYIIEEIR